jgi:hypothetical protein
MSHFSEELESRRLFSVSGAVLADGAAIKAEDVAVKAHATSFAASVKTENNAIMADLKRLHTLTADQARLTTLKHDEMAGATSVKKDASILSTAASKDYMKVIADLRKLSAHPGNLDLEAELSVDLSTLSSATASGSATLQAAYASAETLDGADLSDIAAANATDPGTQSNTNAEKSILASDVATSNSDATALSADVSKFVTDSNA